MSTGEDSLTLAGAGDAIIMRKLRTINDDRFRAIVDQIQNADAAVINFESLVHDYESPPAAGSGGTYMRSPEWVLDELTWAGFNLFTAATNHSFDYSHGGMESTMRHMEEREIAYAGLGRNMAAALEPAYIDTPAGRIALIAACSTITEGSIAGEQRRDMQGRPGIAPLRHEARYTVPEDTYDQIQTLSESLGLEVLKEERENSSFPFSYPADGEDYFELPNVDGSNMRFQQGEEFQIDRVADEEDVQALKDQIHRARREADWVITSLHSHEFSDLVDKQKCATFVESYARTSIDAGADAFIGHGAHALQGIEIYNGAPIFYDLGNFVFQNQLVSRLPSDLYDRYDVDPDGNPADIFDTRVYDENGDPKGFLANDIEWVSILPICKFENGSLAEIRLYPLDLMQDEPRPRRGRPVLATDTKADEIIDQIAEISAPYGTEIVNEDGIGRVKL